MMRALLYRCAVAGLMATAVVAGAVGAAEALTRTQRLILFGLPSWLPRTGVGTPTLYVDFANGRYWYQGNRGSLSAWLAALGGTFTRADSPSGIATDLLPSAAAGAAYHTYAANVPRVIAGSGILIEKNRTNLFLNSTAPATQTINFTSTGTYQLWVNGSGSIAMSAGTATGCGTGTATNGNPVSFTLTATGTCVFAVSGALNFAQVELGSFGSSGIVTGGATAARDTDTFTVPLGAWYRQATGSIRATEIISGLSLGSPADWSLGTSTATGLIRIGEKSGAVAGVDMWVSVSKIFSAATGALTVGSTAKTMMAFQNGDAAVSFNGSSPITGTPTTTGLSAATSQIGQDETGSFKFGFISSLAYWPARVPNADLQRLTK